MSIPREYDGMLSCNRDRLEKQNQQINGVLKTMAEDAKKRVPEKVLQQNNAILEMLHGGKMEHN